jgi:hypothetical protein
MAAKIAVKNVCLAHIVRSILLRKTVVVYSSVFALHKPLRKPLVTFYKSQNHFYILEELKMAAKTVKMAVKSAANNRFLVIFRVVPFLAH